MLIMLNKNTQLSDKSYIAICNQELWYQAQAKN